MYKLDIDIDLGKYIKDIKISDKEYLSNNQKDFYNNYKTNICNPTCAEKRYFKVLNENMINKSLKRIEGIKIRIKNDSIQGTLDKKYQIKSYIEYEIIKDYCKNVVPNYNLFFCQDLNVKTNVLDKIIKGDYSCCKGCDTPMKFINKQNNVLYCYLSKK